MTSDREQQWAQALQKAKQKARRSISVPLAQREKQMKDRMNVYKEKIVTSAEKKNFEETEKIFKKLIELRAEQFILWAEKNQSEFGDIDLDLLDRQTKNYYQDCVNLAVAVDTLLGIEHNL